MTSSQRGFYVSGYTRATMAGTKGSKAVRWSQSHQNQSKFGLKAAIRLHEAGITSNRKSAMLR